MTPQSSRPDREFSADKANSEATSLPLASQEILTKLKCGAAVAEHPTTGELAVILSLALPPLTPGGSAYIEQLARWAIADGVAAIANARAVVIPKELAEQIARGLEIAARETTPTAVPTARPGWLQDAVLNAMGMLGAVASGAVSIDELRDKIEDRIPASLLLEQGYRPQLVDQDVDAGDVVDELRMALVQLSTLITTHYNDDSARIVGARLVPIEQRVARALELIEGEPPISPRSPEVRAELLALDEQPELPRHPPRTTNFAAMLAAALQERDSRGLDGDGIPRAVDELRNALQILSGYAPDDDADRLVVRSLGRRLIDALVAIEPRGA